MIQVNPRGRSLPVTVSLYEYDSIRPVRRCPPVHDSNSLGYNEPTGGYGTRTSLRFAVLTGKTRGMGGVTRFPLTDCTVDNKIFYGSINRRNRIAKNVKYRKWYIGIPARHIHEMGWKKGQRLRDKVVRNTLAISLDEE